MALLTISKLVARSAVQKPATRRERREPFAKTRGHIRFVVDDCVFCNLCARKCPTEAIVCNRKDKTWEINHLACVLCGNCVDSCRKGCLTQENVPAAPMLTKQVEKFRAEAQTPAELDAEREKKGLPKPDDSGCCQNE